jgi:Chromo (CHRromatin Organisation MOdifier) domain
MNKILRKNYVTPGHPTAFSAPGNLKQYYKKIGRNLAKTDILDTLHGVESYTLHREYHKPQQDNPFFIYEKRQQIQMDLIDMREAAPENDGVTFLLVAIDCFTKYVWVRTLTEKSASMSLKAIKHILTQPEMTGKNKPKSIFFDSGTEFKNKLVTNFLNKENIKMMHPSSEKKAAIVERFNKTIQMLIYKYTTENQTRRYIDVLPHLVKSYHNRIHRTIQMTPLEAEKDENQGKLFTNHNDRYNKIVAKRKKPKYEVGEVVRVKKLVPTKGFERSYHQGFKMEHFKIIKVDTRMPIPMYQLQSLDTNEIIRGNFYAEQLQPVKSDVFLVETVLRTRKLRNGKVQLFVKWVGYGPEHNSWIDAENDIVKKFQNQQ